MRRDNKGPESELIETSALDKQSFSIPQLRWFQWRDLFEYIRYFYPAVVFAIFMFDFSSILPPELNGVDSQSFIVAVLSALLAPVAVYSFKRPKRIGRIKLDIHTHSIAIQSQPVNLSTHRIRLERSRNGGSMLLITPTGAAPHGSGKQRHNRLLLSAEDHHRIEKLLVTAQRPQGTPADVPEALRPLQQPERLT